MRTKLKLFWYWFETRYTKILRLFCVLRSTDCIPKGMYCYKYDEERNAKEPTDGYWIKTCKYYKTLGYKYNGCSYLGVITDEVTFNDQCKICGENYGDDYD